MALSNDEASEGIWDVKGEVSAPGAARGRFHGGGVSEGCLGAGARVLAPFFRKPVFSLEECQKNGKDRKRRPVEKKNLLLKKE